MKSGHLLWLSAACWALAIPAAALAYFLALDTAATFSAAFHLAAQRLLGFNVALELSAVPRRFVMSDVAVLLLGFMLRVFTFGAGVAFVVNRSLSDKLSLDRTPERVQAIDRWIVEDRRVRGQWN